VAEVYGSQRRPRRRWGRRLLTTFIVLLILIAIILAVADRLGVSYAERAIGDRVAAQVADQEATSEKPEVTIEGIPFLTQVVSGKYKQIHIQLRNFSGPVGTSQKVQVPLLDIRAKDVRAPLETIRNRQGDIIATSVSGAATIAYSDLAGLSGQKDVKLSEKDGKLAVTAPIRILNQTLTLNGTAALAVGKDNTVQLRFDDVSVDGLPDNPIAQNLVSGYAKQLGFSLKVPTLPLGLKVTKAEPTPAGLVVTAEATEVPLNSGGF
jgi:hypothetical protein